MRTLAILVTLLAPVLVANQEMEIKVEGRVQFISDAAEGKLVKLTAVPYTVLWWNERSDREESDEAFQDITV
ncbi:hypothetical protein OAU50_08505, partial [Planctomycetota bacterium]|nr:hypothetical protein [Planctomycetota bacterium]